jgi:hypothetical protein
MRKHANLFLPDENPEEKQKILFGNLGLKVKIYFRNQGLTTFNVENEEPENYFSG